MDEINYTRKPEGPKPDSSVETYSLFYAATRQQFMLTPAELATRQAGTVQS